MVHFDLLTPFRRLVSAELLNYEFDTKNLVSLIIGGAVGVWYLLKKVGGTHFIRRRRRCL